MKISKTRDMIVLIILLALSECGVGQELEAPAWWAPGNKHATGEPTVFVTVSPCLTGACRTGHQMDNIVSAFIACAMMDKKVEHAHSMDLSQQLCSNA